MELKDMIWKRKSVRSYTDEPVAEAALADIRSFIAQAKPLDPEIRVSAEIIDRSQARCILPWLTPQLIAIFSEEKDGYLENVGFLFQQVDLYLQSIGLGVCWLGMGRLNAQDALVSRRSDGLKYVIMLAFGHPRGAALRTDRTEFRRKALSEISDQSDERLEPARLAPSSVNSQPWYFTHEGDAYHAYCAKPRLLMHMGLGEMNLIDMGIALAHMYVAHKDSFRFFKSGDHKPLKGHRYIGSFTI